MMGETPYSSHTKSPDLSGFFRYFVTYIILSVINHHLKELPAKFSKRNT